MVRRQTPPRESRDVRLARWAYAAALVARLDDLLSEDDPDSHAVEARDIVCSLVALIPGPSPEVPR